MGKHPPLTTHFNGDPEKVCRYMLARVRVRVRTQSRVFDGKVTEVYLSPYESNLTRATVLDDEGRVHNFFIERAHIVIL